jgi:hypothetical protein
MTWYGVFQLRPLLRTSSPSSTTSEALKTPDVQKRIAGSVGEPGTMTTSSSPRSSAAITSAWRLSRTPDRSNDSYDDHPRRIRRQQLLQQGQAALLEKSIRSPRSTFPSDPAFLEASPRGSPTFVSERPV